MDFTNLGVTFGGLFVVHVHLPVSRRGWKHFQKSFVKSSSVDNVKLRRTTEKQEEE